MMTPGTTSAGGAASSVKPVVPFEVVVLVTEKRVYRVDARTSEEAESEVAGFIDDGGAVYDVEIEDLVFDETYPAEQ